jgi:hypothetical protein
MNENHNYNQIIELDHAADLFTISIARHYKPFCNSPQQLIIIRGGEAKMSRKNFALQRFCL